MIRPNPFKYKCLKCGYSKIVKPKSDSLSPRDIMSTCPKCKTKMDRKKLNMLEDIFSLFIR